MKRKQWHDNIKSAVEFLVRELAEKTIEYVEANNMKLNQRQVADAAIDKLRTYDLNAMLEAELDRLGGK